MKPRPLAVINAAGCLALLVLIGVQWRHEQLGDREIVRMRSESAAAAQRLETADRENQALRRDLEGLKESIGFIRESANAAASAKARTAGLEDDLSTAREQMARWQEALADRDHRIRELGAELAAARGKLDEAVTALKRAGAR